MKTLKQIVDAGKLADYMRALGQYVVDILPSVDGDPKNRCLFVLLMADDKSDIVETETTNGERR